MSNFLGSLNRKRRRQFNKLDTDEKKDILAAEVAKKINESAGKEISKAFVKGAIFANKLLYDHYLTKWDELDDHEKMGIAEALVAEIKLHRDKALAMFPEDNQKDTDSESEEK